MSNGLVLLTVPKLLSMVENTLPNLFPTVYPGLISHYYLSEKDPHPVMDNLDSL